MAIVDPSTKDRWRRNIKRRRQEVGELGQQLGQQADVRLEQLFVRRLDRLVSVRRFVLLWVGLFGLLAACLLAQIRGMNIYYQTLQPAPGGVFTEGIIGSFTNPNPLYATGVADAAVSRLIFSGLFKYDHNNQLIGDLATSFQIDPEETQYTVTLKPNITWHDGTPFTADDVVFTYQTIQNINAQSSLYSSWQGVRVSKVDNKTVVFNLPSPLSAFRYNLTNGIVPKHLLGKIPAPQLRSASFNSQPVGTGPFRWKFVEVSGGSSTDRQQTITLAANSRYFDGRPKLDGFSLRTFLDDKQLIQAFESKKLNAIGGLDGLPPGLARDPEIQSYLTPLTSAVMAFFNNSRPMLADANVRRALVSAVDRQPLVKMLTYPGNLVDEPLLRGQLAYDATFAQLPHNTDYANQLLDQAGWSRDATGQRVKNGQPLAFEIVSQNNQNYTVLAEHLQQSWNKLGVKVSVRFYPSDDIQSSIVPNHNYDTLLYGISIGVDPDVFAYWDSSQASISSQGHLNLSEYKNGQVDQSLEAARTRSDPILRAVKYRPFLSAWRDQAPALALYQPQYLYITRGPIFGFGRTALNSDADRFDNVAKWMVREQWRTQQ